MDKPALAGALAKMGAPKTMAMSDEAEPVEESGDTAKAQLGAEVMDAMKSGDGAAFTSALEEFVHACVGGYAGGKAKE